jgi:predicted RNase H-like HicB family nuclease
VESEHEPTSDRYHRARRDGFVALCPELDVASQGTSIEEARDNLREALELFFVTASPSEVDQRLSGELYVTQVEVRGWLDSGWGEILVALKNFTFDHDKLTPPSWGSSPTRGAP